MKPERFDIHQHITNQIIAAIESGAGEFRLPWHRSAGNISQAAETKTRSQLSLNLGGVALISC
jgi:antirestriction protein ArdC